MAEVTAIFFFFFFFFLPPPLHLKREFVNIERYEKRSWRGKNLEKEEKKKGEREDLKGLIDPQ